MEKVVWFPGGVLLFTGIKSFFQFQLGCLLSVVSSLADMDIAHYAQILFWC